MIRMICHKPGQAPSSRESGRHEEPEPTKITFIRYDADSLEEFLCDNSAEAIERILPERINWINMEGLQDTGTITTLCRHFGMNPLMIEDILTTQRSKVEILDQGILVITSMIYPDGREDAGVEVEQLSMFFNGNTVMTFQSGNKKDPFEPVRKRLSREGSLLRKSRGDFLAYALLDSIIDQFFPVLEMIGTDSEKLEEALIRNPTKSALRELFQNKRVLLEIRRMAWPLREVLGHLMREETPFVEDSTRMYLKDCNDHVTQAIDICESFRDLTAGLMEIYHSSLGFRTNEIIRVLTLVSTFFIPLTFLAGVYGMNFSTESPLNMPELHWRYGYLGFWGVVFATALGMFIFFRKNKWL